VNNFTRTVTITLAEYDQLRKDAAPVQNRIRDSQSCLADAFNEYINAIRFASACIDQDRAEACATKRLSLYIRHVQRCILLNDQPLTFEDYKA